MARFLILVVILAGTLAGQFGVKIRWTCPKEDLFSVKHCEGCNPHYCMDGQHFHADEGPVPAWVLNHFAELKRRSQQIRQEIDERGAELRAAHAANVERTKQLNAKYAAEHEAFMRRVQSGQPGGAPRMLTPSASVVAAAPDPRTPPTVVSKADLEQIKIGAGRAEVIERLGTPSSAITIPDDDGAVETLSYRVTTNQAARINLRHGRVIDISVPQF